jgi:hypothetical protein
MTKTSTSSYPVAEKLSALFSSQNPVAQVRGLVTALQHPELGVQRREEAQAWFMQLPQTQEQTFASRFPALNAVIWEK